MHKGKNFMGLTAQHFPKGSGPLIMKDKLVAPGVSEIKICYHSDGTAAIAEHNRPFVAMNLEHCPVQ